MHVNPALVRKACQYKLQMDICKRKDKTSVLQMRSWRHLLSMAHRRYSWLEEVQTCRTLYLAILYSKNPGELRDCTLRASHIGQVDEAFVLTLSPAHGGYDTSIRRCESSDSVTRGQSDEGVIKDAYVCLRRRRCFCKHSVAPTIAWAGSNGCNVGESKSSSSGGTL